jgi:integrase
MVWSDVDLENDKIFVPDSKTKEKREVPIHSTLKEFLLANKNSESMYVVTYNGQKINSIRKSFIKARLKAKISNFRIHDLRHRAVTRWVQSGYPPNVIMKATGHKTYSMFQRYTNLKEGDVMMLVGKKCLPLPLITQGDLKEVG